MEHQNSTPQHRPYHRHRHLLHAVLDPLVCGIRRRLPHALGSRVLTIFCRFVRMARTGNHVPSVRRRESVPRGYLQEAEGSGDCVLCNASDPLGFHSERMHCLCSKVSIDFVPLLGSKVDQLKSPSILVAAGKSYGRWEPRGIALAVITFVTLIHGLTPRAGIWLMNVSAEL